MVRRRRAALGAVCPSARASDPETAARRFAVSPESVHEQAGQARSHALIKTRLGRLCELTVPPEGPHVRQEKALPSHRRRVGLQFHLAMCIGLPASRMDPSNEGPESRLLGEGGSPTRYELRVNGLPFACDRLVGVCLGSGPLRHGLPSCERPASGRRVEAEPEHQAEPKREHR